jgi:hypothetical protein
LKPDVDVTEEKLIEALSEATVGHSLLEKLILSIIDAHPVKDGRTRQNRLNDAMHALRGNYHGRGKRTVDDGQILRWMAVQHARKQGTLGVLKMSPFMFGEDEPTVKHDTVFALSTAAVKRFKFGGTASYRKSIARRLASKFEKEKELLMMEVKFASITPHQIEHQILLEIVRKLRLCDVPCVLPISPKAFF